MTPTAERTVVFLQRYPGARAVLYLLLFVALMATAMAVLTAAAQ
ncbi:MAG TPA: hypothetical protein VJ653_03115 [Acidimicrobiales bacterium]|nr:hypothetical protein [Acidimicrobiales bacterium]